MSNITIVREQKIFMEKTGFNRCFKFGAGKRKSKAKDEDLR
jgi:hypothetical protein